MNGNLDGRIRAGIKLLVFFLLSAIFFYNGLIVWAEAFDCPDGVEDLRNGIDYDVVVRRDITPFRFHLKGDAEKNAITEIEIYREGQKKLLQRFPVNTGAPCKNMEFLLKQDMNFDGYKDIGIPVSRDRRGNVRILFFLYEPETERFVYSEELSGLVSPFIDNKQRLIGSEIFITSQVNRKLRLYQWRDKHLMLVHEELEEELPIKPAPGNGKRDWRNNKVRVIVKDLEKGEMKITSARTIGEEEAANERFSELSERYKRRDYKEPEKPPADAFRTWDFEIVKDVRNGWDFDVVVHPDIKSFHVHLVGDPKFNVITKMEIFRDGKKEPFQTLPVEMDESPYRGDFFKTEDMNFDGYKDIQILNSWGATGNTSWSYWLFDPAKQEFVYNDELSQLDGPYPIENKKLIGTWSNGGAAACIYDYRIYRWEGNKLVLIREAEQDLIEGTSLFHKVVRSLQNGKMEVVIDRTLTGEEATIENHEGTQLEEEKME